MHAIAEEFAKDLQTLHPLSKLQGIGANRESRSKLPNLDKTTANYADDLIMAVTELLNPGDGTEDKKSWQLSRLTVCATLKIVRRLRDLGQ